MLHNLDWLAPGEPFPPESERDRIAKYDQNLKLFENEMGALYDEYLPYYQRIKRVLPNIDNFISFPVVLCYQRLLTLKIADLVCGEYPIITGQNETENETIQDMRDETHFDQKLYESVIDISRYGDGVWRKYRRNGVNTFVCWDPRYWFPIVADDGTRDINYHVLCWQVNEGTKQMPAWKLHAQIHGKGFYYKKVFNMSENGGTIEDEDESKSGYVRTGYEENAVISLRSFATSSTVYGFDDYDTIDAILAELMVRIAQISAILDKHADPSMTGPSSMLTRDETTGRLFLETGSFYAVSPGEEQPKYLTWEGQLEAAFKQVELLLNQLYILSEVGSALLGNAGREGGSAISGTAMRFKMVVPLSKARRVANCLSLSVRELISSLTGIDKKNVSVEWEDGLPDDPRENLEMARLASGRENVMPLVKVITEYFKRSDKEAEEWIKLIIEENEKLEKESESAAEGVNPHRKGSTTGVASFHSETNE